MADLMAVEGLTLTAESRFPVLYLVKSCCPDAYRWQQLLMADCILLVSNT